MLIYLILILAFILRLIALNQSLWLDEAIGALVARDMSYTQILTDFMRVDNHPPLYYLLLKSWTSVFGYSEISLRMPSVLFGVGTVYVTYLICNQFSVVSSQLSDSRISDVGSEKPKTGKLRSENRKPKTDNRNLPLLPLLASLFLATSQFAIYYSQEARMYAMDAFFASLAVYAFLKIMGKGVKPFFWVLYGFAVTAMLFSDYVPVFLMPVFFIVAFFMKHTKEWWIKFLISYAFLIVVGIWWLPYFQIQIENGRWLVATWPQWQNVAGGATFKQAILVWMKMVAGRVSLMNKVLYYGFVLLATLPFMVSLHKGWNISLKRGILNQVQDDIKKGSNISLIWLWLLFPLVSGFITSFFFPAFIYFRFLYVLPALYILAAYGLLQIKKDKLFFPLLLAVLLVNTIGILVYMNDKNQQREEWREAVSFVEEHAKENEMALFEFPEPFAPYEWYMTDKVEAKGATDSINANEDQTKEKTRDLIKDKEGIYYFEYLRDLSDPGKAVEQVLAAEGFIQDSAVNFVGVGQVHYYKRQ